MRTTEESTQAIIESANIFFARFGYGKTTMTEIAEYCDMSVGNLYRFFPSKLDLAAKIVDLVTQESVANLRRVSARKYRSSAARVEALVIAELRDFRDHGKSPDHRRNGSHHHVQTGGCD